MKKDKPQKQRKPNWAIINQVRKERREKEERRGMREIEPGIWIK